MREYERTSTTVINAYVGPPVRRYVRVDGGRSCAAAGVARPADGDAVERRHPRCRSSVIAQAGADRRMRPGGRRDRRRSTSARRDGYRNLITLDMGGTTAKASIDRGRAGSPTPTSTRSAAASRRAASLAGGGGYALKLPVIDISEVGAGGGSIAWLDKAGSLKVGPHSAGAVPGPACYGTGNASRPSPTPTSCSATSIPTALAGGTVPIDAELARTAVGSGSPRPLGRDLLATAYGIHTVANANMMRAVKAVTTYRGRDPRDFALLRVRRQRRHARRRPRARAADPPR